MANATTRLTQKINSYSLESGINFDESYILPPTKTGNLTFGGNIWSRDGLQDPTYQSTVGTFPGAGSWYYENGGGTKSSRVKVGPTFGNSFTAGQFIDAQNYTVGVWLKPIELNITTVGLAIGVCRAIETTPTYASGYNIGFVNSDQAGHVGQQALFILSASSTAYIYDDGAGKPFETGKWYYLAVRKVSSGGNTTTSFFINGNKHSEVTTTTYNSSSNVINLMTWGFQGSAQTIKYNIANYHLASSSVLTESAISDIWKAGAPIQLPVKYYNGTSWELSNDSKVYYNGTWNPIHANKWDGSAWVAI